MSGNDARDFPFPRLGRRGFLAGISAVAVPTALGGLTAGGAQAAPRAPRQSRTIVYGTVLHFLRDPGTQPDPQAWQLFDPGALVVGADGHVEWVGAEQDVPPELGNGATPIDHRGNLVVPGFVDAHIHASQVDVIASYGEQLLQWLQKYVFPAEKAFSSAEHSRMISGLFLDTLLAAGTTTATVHPTVHKTSVDAFFQEAQARGMRMLAGKVLMDREPYAPPDLKDASVQQAEADTRELIDRWHQKDRLTYSITPRFAPSSTEQLLQMVGRLYHERPDLWLQTHAAENKEEVDTVHQLFGGRSYIDVYDRYQMLGNRSVYAHSIYIDDQDRTRLSQTGSSIAFCPTSNLFLGSGLFDLDAARGAGVRVGLGTDIGAGTSYSLLATLNEAYKVLALQQQKLPAMRGFYLATLGGAEALYVSDRIGNFQVGKEADFTVLDWAATPVLKRRMDVAKDFQERLFALMTLGDERAVRATYVLGQRKYDRPAGVQLPS
ncbi:guanine deaminase [Saccharopolyspora rosea]|uniref:Guanine deaminase n=1 Tax=Saccharopolyspora rosea TaxID=524884 RepID=A0ABW3FX38_9PSEU|nr:guanine deaminase [Saccharopolyspora rosea]